MTVTKTADKRKPAAAIEFHEMKPHTACKKRQEAQRFELILRTESSPKKKTLLTLFVKRVILSAGAMLIFSVLFLFDYVPEGERCYSGKIYEPFKS